MICRTKGGNLSEEVFIFREDDLRPHLSFAILSWIDENREGGSAGTR